MEERLWSMFSYLTGLKYRPESAYKCNGKRKGFYCEMYLNDRGHAHSHTNSEIHISKVR